MSETPRTALAERVQQFLQWFSALDPDEQDVLMTMVQREKMSAALKRSVSDCAAAVDLANQKLRAMALQRRLLLLDALDVGLERRHALERALLCRLEPTYLRLLFIHALGPGI